MQAFGSNITIDGGSGTDAPTYESDVLGCLTQLLTMRTGAAVVRDIWSAQPRAVRINRWTGSNPNADATPANWPDGFQGLELVRDNRGAASGGIGTGRGTDVVVRFSPDLHQHSCSFRTLSGGSVDLAPPVTTASDRTTILLHELVHAARFLRGAARRRGITTVSNPNAGIVGGLPARFDDEEELIAITVANLFASERGISLRADHSLNSAALVNEEFWQEPTIFRMLQNFMASMPSLAGALVAVPCRFNPFRDIANGARPFMRLRDWDGRVRDAYN